MSGIMTPVLLVAVIGLVCSALLVFASKVFHVAVDERVTKVREVLPGANCGGCGFAGCDDYASNLVADESLPCTKCSPGGAGVAAQIAEILGRSAGASEPMVANVMCNSTCDASRTVLEWQGMSSCKGAKGWFTSPNACMFGCIGLGDCAEACQFDATVLRESTEKTAWPAARALASARRRSSSSYLRRTRYTFCAHPQTRALLPARTATMPASAA